MKVEAKLKLTYIRRYAEHSHVILPSDHTQLCLVLESPTKNSQSEYRPGYNLDLITSGCNFLIRLQTKRRLCGIKSQNTMLMPNAMFIMTPYNTVLFPQPTYIYCFLAKPVKYLQPHVLRAPSSITAITAPINLSTSFPISICSFKIHRSHAQEPTNPVIIAESTVLP